MDYFIKLSYFETLKLHHPHVQALNRTLLVSAGNFCDLPAFFIYENPKIW